MNRRDYLQRTIDDLRWKRGELQRAIARTQSSIERLNMTAAIGLASRMVPSLERRLIALQAELAALPAEPPIAAPAAARPPVEPPAELLPQAGADPLDIPQFLRRQVAP